MRLNLPYANRQKAKHKDTMQADSSALSLWLLAAANSWLRVPPFTQALFDMVIIKQPCLLHYSHIGMQRQPQEVEKEEWTVRWEERLGRDERLRAVSQFGRLAPRQRIPFPCQSVLSLFWIRLDLHRLMTPEAWDHQRLSAQKQILASWDMHKKTVSLVQNVNIYTQAEAEKPLEKSLSWFTVKKWYKGLKWDQIVYREPALTADGCVFFISPLMRSHFLRSVQQSYCFSPFEFVSIKRRQNPIRQNK